MKEQDRKEFKAYLRACTDRQLCGVLEKETKVQRKDYIKLVTDELHWRQLAI